MFSSVNDSRYTVSGEKNIPYYRDPLDICCCHSNIRLDNALNPFAAHYVAIQLSHTRHAYAYTHARSKSIAFGSHGMTTPTQ